MSLGTDLDPIELSDDEDTAVFGNGSMNAQNSGFRHHPAPRSGNASLSAGQDDLEIMKAEDLPPDLYRAGQDGQLYGDDEEKLDVGEMMDSEDSEDNGREQKETSWSSAPKNYRQETKEEAAKVNEVVTKVYDEMQEYLEGIPCAPQPNTMVTSLMFHQQQALYWMMKQEDKSAIRGGILADDMGVGKTVETIALLCARPVPSTLIVCPMTLLHHWKSEIERHTEPGVFRVGLYYGTHRPKTLEEMKSYNVMITSYGTLSSDYSKIRKTLGIEDDSVLMDGAVGALGLKGNLLYSLRWRRIVLDEAQYIKNRYSSAFHACHALPGNYRLALSGTPIQNSLDDLFSLLKFIRFPDFPEYAEFRRHILKPVSENRPSGYSELAQLIRRCMLRRRKDQMLRGNKIVDLPPVTNNVIHLDFEPGDLLFYQATERRIMDQFNELASHGEGYVMRHYTHVLVLLLRLRQAACHPYLVAMGHMPTAGEGGPRNGAWDFDQLEMFTEKIVEALKKAQSSIKNQHDGELSDEQIMKLITERVAMGFVINSTGALCASCNRPAESPVITPCKHIHCSACTNERHGFCASCNTPYGTNIGQPLRPATPGELYAAVHPGASSSDISAAIDAAEIAEDGGLEIDTQSGLSELRKVKTQQECPKLLQSRSTPVIKKSTTSNRSLFQVTKSSIAASKSPVVDVITIDDEDDDVLVPIATPLMAPPPIIARSSAPSSVFMMNSDPVPRNGLNGLSPSPPLPSALKPPAGALKVTLRPFNPMAPLSAPEVIKHDMSAPPRAPSPSNALTGVSSSSATPSTSVTRKPLTVSLGGRRTHAAVESNSVVMSRAKLTNFNKFRPNIPGAPISVPVTPMVTAVGMTSLDSTPETSPRSPPSDVNAPLAPSALKVKSEPDSPDGASLSSDGSISVASKAPSHASTATESSHSHPMTIIKDEGDDVLATLIPLPAMPHSRPRKSKRNSGFGDDVDDLEGSDSDVSNDGNDDGSDLRDFIVNDSDVEDEEWGPNNKKRKRQTDVKPNLAAMNGKKEPATAKKAKMEDFGTAARDGTHEPIQPAAFALPNFRITGAAARRALRATELKRHSTKLTALLSALELLKNAGGEDKIVIYSQFVRYMDIIEVPLRNWGWKMLRLDGSLNQPQRAELLKRFDTDPSCRILLISLKAGGVGINLTVANHIFLMDPWWNTAVEKQAVDRVHRIGQKKPIFVTRFFVKLTVEQRILMIQAAKDKVADRALSNRRGDAPPRAGLSFAELRQLFTSSFNQPANQSEEDTADNDVHFAPNRRFVDPLPASTLSHDQSYAPDPFRPL